MKSVATVVIGNSTRQYDREYSYNVPRRLAGKVAAGIRVIVPFGRSDTTRQAYVLDVCEKSDTQDLKEICDVLDDSPVICKDLIELGRWMKKRYICTYSDVFRSMLPAGLGIKRRKTIKVNNDKIVCCTAAEEKILSLIRQEKDDCFLEDLNKKAGSMHLEYHIRNLEKKGLIETSEVYNTRVREKHIRAAGLARPPEEIAELIESNSIRSIQQLRVLECLLENEYVTCTDLQVFAGVSGRVIKALENKGYIAVCEIEEIREPETAYKTGSAVPLELTEQQKRVFDSVVSLADSGFHEILLHGVTGSGKTEVYMQIASHIIGQGRQAVVLVPEISLTPQMTGVFKARFGDKVAVLHSRLSLGERYDQWRLIREGGISVVVGARSAVFAPLQNLGLIVIDEEHEDSYRSGITPKYDARDIARRRCMQSGALLLLGSATPSVETFWRAERKKTQCYKMTTRPNRMNLPQVETVDMREELSTGNRTMFSSRLQDEIRKNLSSGQQTLLLLNRRGHSNFVLCRNCGYAVMCPGCSITLTYHSRNDRLVCHYCGYTVKTPSCCPACKSRYIRFFGAGTQKLENEIESMFPKASVIRMDMDTTARKNAHEKILKAFRDEKIDMLVGTQMIAKGHDFPNVTLVGVMAADSMLNVGDYRAAERTFQLLAQVSGRAGRGSVAGRVIIQTYNTDHYSVTSACSHDYGSFYRQEMLARKKLGYPPFSYMGVLILSGRNDDKVYQKAEKIYRMTVGCLGKSKAVTARPKRSPLARIKGMYRWRIIVRCQSLYALINAFTAVSDSNGTYRDREIRLSVDINPVSML